MKIYKLSKNIFEYQAINFFDINYNKLCWEINGKQSIKDNWNKEIPIVKLLDKKRKTIRDFTDLGTDLPIFGIKAIEILKEFFIDGEMLPLKTEKGKEFFLYNIFPEIDCVDLDNSIFDWSNDTKTAMGNRKKISFQINKIDKAIFRAKYLINYILVTDKFVNKVLENNLKGFQFILLWDSENGGIYDYEDKNINTRILT